MQENRQRLNTRNIRNFIVLCAHLAAFGLNAQTLYVSQFTNGDDGWTIVNWNGEGTPVTPTWENAGYVRGTDVHGDGFWRAPEHSERTAAYGGSLSYDVYANGNDWKMNEIYIVGTAGTLTYWFTNNPGPQWSTYTAPIGPTAGWQIGMNYDTIGTNATEAEILAVLADVTELRIREEYAWGSDDSGLDNVVLIAGHGVPRPKIGVNRAEAGEIALPCRRSSQVGICVERLPFSFRTRGCRFGPSSRYLTATHCPVITNAQMYFRLGICLICVPRPRTNSSSGHAAAVSVPTFVRLLGLQPVASDRLNLARVLWLSLARS